MVLESDLLIQKKDEDAQVVKTQQDSLDKYQEPDAKMGHGGTFMTCSLVIHEMKYDLADEIDREAYSSRRRNYKWNVIITRTTDLLDSKRQFYANGKLFMTSTRASGQIWDTEVHDSLVVCVLANSEMVINSIPMWNNHEELTEARLQEFILDFDYDGATRNSLCLWTDADDTAEVFMKRYPAQPVVLNEAARTLEAKREFFTEEKLKRIAASNAEFDEAQLIRDDLGPRCGQNAHDLCHKYAAPSNERCPECAERGAYVLIWDHPGGDVAGDQTWLFQRRRMAEVGPAKFAEEVAAEEMMRQLDRLLPRAVVSPAETLRRLRRADPKEAETYAWTFRRFVMIQAMAKEADRIPGMTDEWKAELHRESDRNTVTFREYTRVLAARLPERPRLQPEPVARRLDFSDC